MPTFIICSLLLSFLVQNDSPYVALLASPTALIFGLAAIAASLIGALLKKMPGSLWHDLFAAGTLVTWFAYWHEIFNDDALMFYFFPLYFALLTALITLLVVNRIEHFDDESFAQLRFLQQNARLNTPAIVIFVLSSVVITRHYMLYPIAMTLFVMRYMLTRCLETAGE
ncbi:MAG: hypothetical protein ACU837_06380 [Gammaproteobacteria bacterium]